MAVFDTRLARVTIFGPDLLPARTFRLDGQFFSGLLLKWPHVVMNGHVPTPNGFGQPLHLLDLSSGEVIKSFGSLEQESFTARDVPRLFMGLLEGSDSSHFLAVPRTRLSIQRWSADGELTRVLDATPEWFPTGKNGRMGSAQSPPDPVILSAVRQGRIVFLSVHLPRAEWQQAWEALETAASPHGPDQQRPTRESVYDYILLAVDLEKRRVVNRWSTEDPFRPFSRAGGAFVTAGPTGAMIPVLRILRPSIRRVP